MPSATQNPVNENYMSDELFNELLTSVKQAGAIRRGEMAASRVFSYPTPDVKAVREQTGLSQGEFASRLMISKRTLENWEQHHRKPTGVAIALLRLVERNPTLLNELAL